MALRKDSVFAWVFNDLHLEHVNYPDGYEVDRPHADLIICAGDTWRGEIERGFAFLAHLARGKPIIATLGNHCHSGGEIFETNRAAKELARQYGIHLLQDSAIEVLGVTFVGATLWTDGQLADGEILSNSIVSTDLRVATQIGEQTLTYGAMAQIHAHSRRVLADFIDGHDGRTPLVVVTHHAPHRLCLAPEYRTGAAAGNSASDLSDLTDSGRVQLWVHGHVHQNVDLVRPGGTRIICNPAGRQFSNASFDDGMTVEIHSAHRTEGLRIPREDRIN